MAAKDAQLYTASLTPFAPDGALDVGLVDAYHEWLESKGVDGVFAAGTTGEFIALEEDERIAVITSALKIFGTDRVIAHVGAATLRQAVRLTERARDAGATRFTAMTPWFEPAHPAALMHHYVEIDRIGQGETYAYHFPARTTAQVPPQQVREIAAEAGLAGIKVSGLPADELLAYVAPGFEVFTGNDATFATVVRGGAAGAVSGMSSAFPEVFVEMRDALRAGDDDAVARAQTRIERVIAACEGVNFALIKRALDLRGVTAGPVRVALDAPNQEQVGVLVERLDELGLSEA